MEMEMGFHKLGLSESLDFNFAKRIVNIRYELKVG